MKVRVLGAGVAGLAIATELVAHGISVELVDIEPSLGPHCCSWYAGGMLAPFCEGDVADDLIVQLGQEAFSWWAKHTSHIWNNGSLVIAAPRDGTELKRFSRNTKEHDWLDGDAISRLEPDLAGRCSKALFFAREAHIDPRAALGDLRNNLSKAGVDVRTQQASIDADLTIDARGFSARKDLADLRGVKGEMVVLRTSDVKLNRPVRLLHPRQPVYIVPRGDGTFMVGATQIESEDRSRITARGLVELLSSAYTVHPAFGEAEVIETGCDVRPAFPDNRPRIRRRGNIIYVNGFFRHGFLLAPAMAKRTVKLILDPNYSMELIDENTA